MIIAAEDEDMDPGAKRMRSGISDSVIVELTECNAALSQQRKKRQVLFIQHILINSNYLFVDNIFILSLWSSSLQFFPCIFFSDTSNIGSY